MTRLLLLLSLCAIPTGAGAHEAPSGFAYPIECCSGQDCREIAETDIAPNPNGWLVKATGEVISFKRTRISPDGKPHRCTRFFANPNAQDKTICLFVPPMSF